ncbi:MAG: hypothetical protein ACI8W3_000910, partial [Myxococcota bacterium]
YPKGFNQYSVMSHLLSAFYVARCGASKAPAAKVLNE